MLSVLNFLTFAMIVNIKPAQSSTINNATLSGIPSKVKAKQLSTSYSFAKKNINEVTHLLTLSLEWRGGKTITVIVLTIATTNSSSPEIRKFISSVEKLTST